MSLANKFYLFYLPKTLISGRSFHTYLNTLHRRSENSLCVTAATWGWNASFLSPGFSASLLGLLLHFVSGLLFFWSRTGWWETGRRDFSFRQDCRVNSDVTLRNPASDSIFRSSPYGRIKEASLTLQTPLHTMHLFLLSVVVSTHEVLLYVFDSIFIWRP